MSTAVADRLLPSGAPALRRRSIASLDGLRAVSILLVLLGHGSLRTGWPAWLVGHADLGVQVFFLISGFLITTLLLREASETGTIDLRRFYIRRSLRIFPACYAFLAVIVSWSVWRDGRAPANVLPALTYTMNFAPVGTWTLGHLWSLAVEEQFYLVWPPLVLLCAPRRALRVAAGLAVCVPVLFGALYVARVNVGNLPHTFPLVADTIALGCVLAGWVRRTEGAPWFRRWVGSRLGGCVPLLVLLVDAVSVGHPRIYWPLGRWLTNAGIAYCVARYATHVDLPGARFLNWRPMVWLGVLSYSLYLWQQVFFNPFADGLVTRFPLNLLAALAAAVASYRLVERPLFGLRQRFRAG